MAPFTAAASIDILSIFAPFVAEEMWSDLGGEFSVHSQKWPEYDESLLVSDTVNLSVQINGKLRGLVEVSPDADEEEVKSLAEADEKIKKYLEVGEIVKVIFIKGKTINFVVK